MSTLKITISDEEYEKVRNANTLICELYRSAWTCQRSKYVDADGRPLKYLNIEMRTKSGKFLCRAFRSISVRFFSHYPDEPNKKHYVITFYPERCV